MLLTRRTPATQLRTGSGQHQKRARTWEPKKQETRCPRTTARVPCMDEDSESLSSTGSDLVTAGIEVYTTVRLALLRYGLEEGIELGFPGGMGNYHSILNYHSQLLSRRSLEYFVFDDRTFHSR